MPLMPDYPGIDSFKGVSVQTSLWPKEGVELEADRYGMEYMQRAGYDVQGAVTLQEKFVRLSENKQSSWFEGLFASHPPSEERLEANRKRAAKLPQGRCRSRS